MRKRRRWPKTFWLEIGGLGAVLILLVSLPLGLGALVIAARAWRQRAQAQQARLWPHTTGRIKEGWSVYGSQWDNTVGS